MSPARTAVLAVAALLASCGAQPRREAEPKPEPAPAALPAPSRGISIAAVGDIMMGTDYPENTLPDDDGVGFLAGVAPILSAADVAFGNLEGVLMDGGEAVKRCKPAKRATEVAKANTTTAPQNPPALPAAPTVIKPPAEPEAPPTAPKAEAGSKAEGEGADADVAPTAGGDQAALPAAPAPPENAAPGETAQPASPAEAPTPAAADAASTPAAKPGRSCFVFRTPTRYATYLRDAGLDVASLANNHAQDFGDAGRESTMRALDDVGIRHSGRDGDVAEWVSQGRRFALVAFAPNVGAHQLNDLARARQIVTELAARHDIVIVSFHGGGEGEGASALTFTHELYQGEDRGDVVEFAHAVVDAGADLVLGHGPHVLRAMELYHDRLIAYSLGNFATYYGISVNGIRGIAAVLVARLDNDGRLLDARIESTIQIRPGGPQPDAQRRAVAQLRELTNNAFPQGRLNIEDDGRVTLRQ